MAKIMLVHPAFEGKYSGMPLGLVYVGTALQQRGHDVSISDVNTKEISEREVIEKVQRAQPNYVGIASTSPTHLDACRIAQQIKKVTDAPIIKGGTHETYCFETTLKHHPEIDYSVIGPGEETICELVDALENGKNGERVNGIALRKNGSIMTTGHRDLKRDLDDYGHPDRTLLTPSRFYDFSIFDGEQTTQVRMSRGCSYGCNFCPVDRTYVFNSPNHVIAELGQIVEQGYGAVFWDDAIFTANRRLVDEVLQRSIANGLQLKMGAQTRADVHITPEMLSLMKSAGFTFVSFGMESGDQKVLEDYNKKLSVESVERAVGLARDAGIRTAVTAIIGAPNETLDSVMRSIETMNRIRPDAISWSVYSIYPGSFLQFDAEWYEDQNLSRDDFWRVFDEGFKAKHARDREYIEKAWEVVKANLDPGIRI